VKIFIASVAVLAVVVIAAVFLLSGGESSLARAADNLEGQSVRVKLTLGTVENGQELAMVGTAVQNADSSRVQMDVDTSIDGGEPVPQKIVLIGDDVWVGNEQFEEIKPGKRWFHSVDKETAPSTMTMAEFAEFLREADEIDDKGETQVNGKPVTHYQGNVNVRELADETGGETAKRYSTLLGDRDVYLPIEAWVGEDDRIARLAMTVDAGDRSMSFTADIVEYGVSTAHIKPPPEDETMSEEEFDRLTQG
jgi:HAMP domain-containing protein